MFKQILLLRLEGPFQTWNNCKRSGDASENYCPSKIGIVQLLSRALGYDAGDERVDSELKSGIKFGVRIESPGHYPNTSETTISLPSAAINTPRGRRPVRPRGRKEVEADPVKAAPSPFLADASFLVALESTASASSDLLARCTAALIRPAERIQLGHRSCPPTRPVFERFTSEYRSIEQALAMYPWAFEDKYSQAPLPAAELVAFVEDQGSCTGTKSELECTSARCSKRITISLDNLMKSISERRLK